MQLILKKYELENILKNITRSVEDIESNKSMTRRLKNAIINFNVFANVIKNLISKCTEENK